MADYRYENVPVHVRHVPDVSRETDASGRPVDVELPGFIEIGVEVDGAWIPIERRKAAGIFADITRAQQQQEAAQQQQAQQAQPAQQAAQQQQAQPAQP